MNRLKWIAAAVALVVLAVLPLQSTPYLNSQLALVAVYAVVILGLNLVTGYAGQISLGQSAFFGLGAYAGAITTVAGWPAVASFALACLLPAVVGALVALPAVRLRGHALAMVTLALPVVAVPLAKRLEPLTGGSQGLTVPGGGAPQWTGLDADQWTYYVVLAVAAVLFGLAYNLVRGRLGRALALVKSNDVVAASMGVSPRNVKVMAFTVAALYAGAGGYLYVLVVRFVSPESLELILGVTLLCSMVVGGMGSIFGAVLGGLFYVYAPVVAGGVSTQQSALLYGACLLLVIFFAPRGVAGALYALARRVLGRRTPRPPEGPHDDAVPTNRVEGARA